MLTRLRRKRREGKARQERLKDKAAIRDALRGHEQAEREKTRPVDLPPGRTNTDWTYLGPFSGA